MSGEGLIAEARAVHASVGHARLKELMHRGTEFLGCEVAIMGGAMSWVSERNLVSALSNAGHFTFPVMSPWTRVKWMRVARGRLSRNNSAPPMTMTSGTSPAARSAASRSCTTTTPSRW